MRFRGVSVVAGCAAGAAGAGGLHCCAGTSVPGVGGVVTCSHLTALAAPVGTDTQPKRTHPDMLCHAPTAARTSLFSWGRRGCQQGVCQLRRKALSEEPTGELRLQHSINYGLRRRELEAAIHADVVVAAGVTV